MVRAYQSVCTEVIQRYDGYIAQYLGDGLLVYFGYPVAHEEDAQRAVHSGLGIVASLKTLSTRLEQDKGIRLAVRLGIHTGLVVVGEMGGAERQEPLALGETPNVAARIQGMAEPDTLVISSLTYRLIQGYFECQELGVQILRGVAEPITVYRVLSESGVQSRLDVAATRGLTPLVGRESEVALLLERWEQVKDGQGQVILLSGEAGIDKSRLVRRIHGGNVAAPRITKIPPAFERRPLRSATPKNAFEASQRHPPAAAPRSRRWRRPQPPAAACQSGAQQGLRRISRPGHAAPDG